MLFVASSYCPFLDLTASLMIDKYMRLQHHTDFLLCQITPVNMNEGVT